ncbi:fructose-1,6-bisphosphatase class 1/Sedoheputulose-1,7-bisphosphatase [Gorgonomyces haynaldii]|nr:fructose-1,6-bisphosphatase class 1/Sedoheputulose-1,7-bisphosphatase [Gorgonomyces haynaldii]
MPQDDLQTDIKTITGFILSHQQMNKEASGDLSILLNSIATACKWISNVVRKAELLHVIGVTGVQNVQQENVQKLDILSNDIMVNMLKASQKAALLVSEEVDEAIAVDGPGHYAVAFDPLDGSSNIDCGVSVGTIFGIYRVDKSSGKSLKEQILCPGSKMIAGGYCMYGSCTILVLALGGEVNGFTLDPNIGEFVLTHRKMTLGKKKIYSLNEGYAHSFHPAIKGYLDTLKFPPPGHQGKFTPYSARYVGSMVADMHRTLLYGGVFLYPGAKLRMLYECFPMAMIVEAAGGKASNGTSRILDLTPKGIHDRSAIFLGNKEEVEAIEQWFQKTSSQL